MNHSSNTVHNYGRKTSRGFVLVFVSSHGGHIDIHAHTGRGPSWPPLEAGLKVLFVILSLFFGCVGGKLTMRVSITDWKIKDVRMYCT